MLIRALTQPDYANGEEYAIRWYRDKNTHMISAIEASVDCINENDLYSGADPAVTPVFRVPVEAIDAMTEQERQDFYYGDPVEIPEEALDRQLSTWGTLLLVATPRNKHCSLQYEPHEGSHIYHLDLSEHMP